MNQTQLEYVPIKQQSYFRIPLLWFDDFTFESKNYETNQHRQTSM